MKANCFKKNFNSYAVIKSSYRKYQFLKSVLTVISSKIVNNVEFFKIILFFFTVSMKVNSKAALKREMMKINEHIKHDVILRMWFVNLYKTILFQKIYSDDIDTIQSYNVNKTEISCEQSPYICIV